jgi:hypothetical protein
MFTIDLTIKDKRVDSFLQGWTPQYVINAHTLKEDRELKTESQITLPPSANIDILFFCEKDYIHNETAFLSIDYLKYRIATIEMLAASIATIRRMLIEGSLDSCVTHIVALGNLFHNPQTDKLKTCAYCCVSDTFKFISPMTGWSSPWRSKEVGYLVQLV